MVFETMGMNAARELPKQEKEKSETPIDIEANLFTEYVAQTLEKKGATVIADSLRSGKMNIEIYKRKAVNMGNLALTAAENQGEEDFDTTGFLLKKAEEAANDLIETSKKKY